MGENSKIQWTDHTFNPWIGCTKVSEACKHCYAEKFAERYGYAKWGEAGDRTKTAATNWKKPYQWNRAAAKEGVRRRVFCASLADIFDDHASIKQEWRDELFKMIRETPHLDWLLLTKRPENYVKFLPPDWGKGYPNVWLGISVENHQRAVERIPILKSTPAAVRFLSVEPMVGLIKPSEILGFHKGVIDWIIIGGESGPITKIRELNLLMVRLLMFEAQALGVKVFFKQLGSILAKNYKLNDGHGGTFDEYPKLLNWLKVREIPNSHSSFNVGTFTDAVSVSNEIKFE